VREGHWLDMIWCLPRITLVIREEFNLKWWSITIPYATPSPIYKLYSTPPHVPEQLSKYVEIECSDISILEGYTSQTCYSIDSESNTFGVVYYKGDLIKAVAAYLNTSAPSVVSKKIGYFQGYVASVAGWGFSDMLKCIDALSNIHDGDSHIYGNYTVVKYKSIDGDFLVILLVEDWLLQSHYMVSIIPTIHCQRGCFVSYSEYLHQITLDTFEG
jgi:hypothetical protein